LWNNLQFEETFFFEKLLKIIVNINSFRSKFVFVYRSNNHKFTKVKLIKYFLLYYFYDDEFFETTDITFVDILK
jgi:hypothetical protein